MLYEVQHVKQTFTLPAPERWKGDYTYDSTKSWGSRSSHNPWCWFSTSDRHSYPHFTAWADDFSGAGPTATLLGFHITFNYRGQTHKPVHVYYRVRSDYHAEYTGTDANRAGAEKQGARGYVNDNWKDFDQLAEAFLDGAFAVPPAGPLGHLAGQGPAVIAAASQRAIFDSISNDDL